MNSILLRDLNRLKSKTEKYSNLSPSLIYVSKQYYEALLEQYKPQLIIYTDKKRWLEKIVGIKIYVSNF